ncbi:alpha,alpha-trehalase [Cryptococcus wingfieldii CBS 7118]|uniref:Trehalase n=1 Tax=Cryptococcus wingfieldii CBS 7118 TaxID=1295528 RepID=A0A1E3IQ69_9TREE|nr:alpha,alpha-trehalase [Cryptococcus wingfieldii CBS 7118]ODN90750.1 alpha,alpha-trehalase [Cryptococcus wingfieldii CBS 7118]
MPSFLGLAALPLLGLVSAQNITQTTSFSFSPTPVTTSVPSPTVPLNSSVDGQGDYPAIQALCDGGADVPFCPGILLHDVQLARIFADSKPTLESLNETQAAWEALTSNSSNVTVGDIQRFVEDNFKGEGLELSQVELQNFTDSPAFLDNVTDPVYQAWAKVVHGYWTLLARETNQSALCSESEEGGCESSLIPLNHTIIVPGGRYREIYYWDSYASTQAGLLKSELYDYAWALLSNFMDLIDTYGYLPNGGRKYYLNRSQPPVFVQMLDAYIKVTSNVTILGRALPIASSELEWWTNNRTTNITSPYTNTSVLIAHYNVTNSAPRPEGYVEDYETANSAGLGPLNQTEKEELWAELASGAESGWDYSSRWCEQPLLNETDNNPALRTLKVRSIVPVDLLSLIMADERDQLANLYELYENSQSEGGDNSTSSDNSTSIAKRQDDSSASATESSTDSASVTESASSAESATSTESSTIADSTTALGNSTASATAASGNATSTASSGNSTESSSASNSSTASSTASTGNSTANSTTSAAASNASATASSGGGIISGNSTSSGNGTESSGNDTASKIEYHRALSQQYAAAILDLCWDAEKSWFYDFNITSNSRSEIYHPGGTWPLWQNITPPGLENNETAALALVSGQRYLLGHYSGVPSVASLLQTGLNWDFPNAWPPHAYTSIKSFETIARLLPNASTLPNLTISFDEVVPSQLGLNQSDLQPQPQETIGNVSLTTDTSKDQPWPLALSIEFANRYLGAAFCSWYSTGGQIEGLLTQLSISDLNATGTFTEGQSGVMFEKFNVTDTDAAGGGGEYTVQVGFGWTNGVALWAAAEYGQYIPSPTCPLIPIIEANSTEGSNSTSATNSTDSSRGPTANDNSTESGNSTSTSTTLFAGYRIPRE